MMTISNRPKAAYTLKRRAATAVERGSIIRVVALNQSFVS